MNGGDEHTGKRRIH